MYQIIYQGDDYLRTHALLIMTAYITFEEVQTELRALEQRWYLNEDRYGHIRAKREELDLLRYYAENTTYFREKISYLAYEAYSQRFRDHGESKQWHRAIQKTLLDTGLEFYLLTWEEELVCYAMDVAGVDVQQYRLPLNECLLRHLPFLMTHGLNVNLPDEEGNTLIHHIALGHQFFYELFDLLLPLDPDWMLSNHHGETPLEMVRGYQTDVYSFLLTVV